MESWFRLPLAMRCAAIGLGWLAYMALTLRLLPGDAAGRITLPVGIACAVGAACTAAADHRLHRRFDSVEQLTTYRRALRTGKLPNDIGAVELDDWRRWLRGSEVANGLISLWVSPFVLMAFLVSLGSESPYHWLASAAFGGLFLWGAFVLVQRGTRIKQLKAAARRRQASARPVGNPTKPSDAAKHQDAFEMSMPGRMVGGGVVLFVGAFLVVLIADAEALFRDGPRIVGLGWAAACAALLVVVWAVLSEERDLRRNFATFEEYSAYGQAVRSGGLPADIEPDVWRVRLKCTRRENLFRLVLACYFLATGVASVLTEHSVYRWVSASLFEVIAIYFLINWWTARERLTALMAAVDRHAIRRTWG